MFSRSTLISHRWEQPPRGDQLPVLVCPVSVSLSFSFPVGSGKFLAEVDGAFPSPLNHPGSFVAGVGHTATRWGERCLREPSRSDLVFFCRCFLGVCGLQETLCPIFKGYRPCTAWSVAAIPLARPPEAENNLKAAVLEGRCVLSFPLPDPAPALAFMWRSRSTWG